MGHDGCIFIKKPHEIKVDASQSMGAAPRTTWVVLVVCAYLAVHCLLFSTLACQPVAAFI